LSDFSRFSFSSEIILDVYCQIKVESTNRWHYSAGVMPMEVNWPKTPAVGELMELLLDANPFVEIYH
jgi:hypothetical protein